MKKIMRLVMSLIMTIGMCGTMSAQQKVYVWKTDGTVAPFNISDVDSIGFYLPASMDKKFSVSDTKKVSFSPGNLQYNFTTKTFHFAPHQWDYIGEKNLSSVAANGPWLDLFCWGTGNNPLWASPQAESYESYTEWGVNKIGNDAPNTWRTLTRDEWYYLFKTRANASSKYGAAKVNDVGGLVILPDDWKLPSDCQFTPGMMNQYDWYYATNDYSITQWEKMEKAGAIFLPAAGYRYYNGSEYIITLNVGHYWSSTPTNDIYYQAWDLYFTTYSLDARDQNGRYFGSSVRLVSEYETASVFSYKLTLKTQGEGVVKGAATYRLNQVATISATPATGYTFVQWSDGNTESTRQITMTQNMTLTAIFTTTYTLTATVEGEGTGIVTGSGTYPQGEMATLTAIPDVGCKFVQWSDGITENPRRIIMTQDLTLSAVFVKGGRFSVRANMEVVFSPGNLQYQASTDTWRFAENQWDYVGNATYGNVYIGEEKCNNENISATYNGWIDLFGWGTGDAPTKTSDDDADFSIFTDWGANVIHDDDVEYEVGTWRTLAYEEWKYLFEERSNGLWGLGTIGGRNGLIILPDDWTQPSGVPSFIAGINAGGYSNNTYTMTQWKDYMEANGAVFLPAAGIRLQNNTAGGYPYVENTGSTGKYWSSTVSMYTSFKNNAHSVEFNSVDINDIILESFARGLSVRLVRVLPE